MSDVVTVRMGKNGLTQVLIDEVRDVLAARKTVKVKMLKAALEEGDKHELTERLKRAVKARRASLMGHTITLEK